MHLGKYVRNTKWTKGQNAQICWEAKIIRSGRNQPMSVLIFLSFNYQLEFEQSYKNIQRQFSKDQTRCTGQTFLIFNYELMKQARAEI